jgi:enolase
MQISDFKVEKIKNSRGRDTILIKVKTNDRWFEASAPEGASTGENEVYGFSKDGIDYSIQFASSLGLKLIEQRTTFREFQDLKEIEALFSEVDKTKNYSITGGNTLYAIEAAILKALAAFYKKELWEFLIENEKPVLPMPLGNCIGGGKHTQEKEKPDFQEFLFLPKLESFKEAFNINLKAYNETKKQLKERDKLFKNKITDEKAYISYLDNESIITLLKLIQEKTLEKYKKTFELGLDIASSSFYDKKIRKYKYETYFHQAKNLTKEEQIDYIAGLIKKYNLVYVEDPLEEEDFEGFAELLKRVRKTNPETLIVGDDLICTNLARLKKAIANKSVNGIIVKPNQIGSLLEMKKVVDLAKQNNIVPIVSHRSGETEDNTIAHLAVGWQIPIIKTGITGKERLAKLKELERIEKKVPK